MSEDNLLDTIYYKNPGVRCLIQLVPGGSIIDTALSIQIENIRQERLKTFFDELDAGDIELSEEIVQSEDFLHCYFATTNAALRSRRREKIILFAKLLKSSMKDSHFSDTDQYEELLVILDELSYTEWLILLKLKKYEREAPLIVDENPLQRATHFWPQFTNELIEELKIKEDEIDSMLTRLNRTGCYDTFVGAYFDYSGGKGKTTPIFNRLHRFIMNEY